MTWRTRRALSLFLLLVWLPLYVVAAVTLTGWLGRLPVLAELGIYAGLGFLWALPFRGVFRGISRDDPDRAAGAAEEDARGSEGRNAGPGAGGPGA